MQPPSAPGLHYVWLQEPRSKMYEVALLWDMSEDWAASSASYRQSKSYNLPKVELFCLECSVTLNTISIMCLFYLNMCNFNIRICSGVLSTAEQVLDMSHSYFVRHPAHWPACPFSYIKIRLRHLWASLGRSILITFLIWNNLLHFCLPDVSSWHFQKESFSESWFIKDFFWNSGPRQTSLQESKVSYMGNLPHPAFLSTTSSCY